MFLYTTKKGLELQCNRCFKVIPKEYYVLLVTRHSGYEPIGLVPEIKARYILCKDCDIVIRGILEKTIRIKDEVI